MPSTATLMAPIYQRPFGGHTANYGEKPVQRACAAADRTGHALLHTCTSKTSRPAPSSSWKWMALDLIRDADGDAVSVTALEMEPATCVLHAKTVLFATGGAGRIYQASTNAFISTGDGLGMAARAGIPLEDMEFWQFHPTGVAGAGVLLTEGCRGEGAILRNSNGERFMERYAPTLKDLAPRDFVSRRWTRKSKGRSWLRPQWDYVLLDMTHLGADTIMKACPRCVEITITSPTSTHRQGTHPVVPTIHYQMGGIPTTMYGQVVVAQERQAQRNHQRPVVRRGQCSLRVGARRQPSGHQLAA